MEKIPMSFKTMFRTSGIVYKRNFGRLFLPLLLFQLVLLVPLMFFTMPGTVSVARSLLLTLSQTGGSSLSSVVTVLCDRCRSRCFCVAADGFKRGICHRQRLFGEKRVLPGCKRAREAPVRQYAAVIFLCRHRAARSCRGQDRRGHRGHRAARRGSGNGIARMADRGHRGPCARGPAALFGIVFIPYTVAVEGQRRIPGGPQFLPLCVLGNFWSNFTRVLTAAVIVALAGVVINWLSQLPFKELYELYLVEPMLALQNPLMVFVILFALLAIVVVTFVFPFWYAFTYHTYRNAKYEYEQRSRR